MYLFDYNNKSMKLIIKITRKFDELVETEIRKSGLKVSFYKVLSAVYENNGAKQHALAEKLGVKASSMSVMLRKLESKKYIKRSVDPFDGRATKVCVTERGSSIAEGIKNFEDKLMDCFLSNFSEEERFKLSNLLEVVDKTEIKMNKEDTESQKSNTQ
ncbi:MAG: MarR family transcriptional regulator [Bacteroides sp.]|nr:MarR family transcriptional regulator [Bacteroides sp.]